MPDTWEYPWYAAWDLAFHCVAARPRRSAVRQGPAAPDVPRVVHAPERPAARLRVGLRRRQPARARLGRAAGVRASTVARDHEFLERIFHKLLLNFTWWVNRKDAEGKNVFEGGFLGLDNIGPIDRSAKLPVDGHLDAVRRHGVDGDLLPQPARDRPRPGRARPGVRGHGDEVPRALRPHRRGASEELWDEETGFYYDVVDLGDGGRVPLRVRSMVGLLPLAATTTLGRATLDRLPDFARRLSWFTMNKPELAGSLTHTHVRDGHEGRLFGRGAARAPRPAARGHARRGRVPLAPRPAGAVGGPREHPFTVDLAGMQFSVDYEPGESTTDLFGGNSNWRGPVWFPVNHLLIEAVQRYARFFGDDLTVECPTGSGRLVTSSDVADELAAGWWRRSSTDADGRRPAFGGDRAAADRPGAPRPPALQRVLPRRHRRRSRCLAPDRLDRPRRRPRRPPWSAVRPPWSASAVRPPWSASAVRPPSECVGREAAMGTSAVTPSTTCVTNRPLVGTSRP